ncbi:MAG: PQQ-binding-like beta-propeller repeat protein [Rhodobacteraceae bacterium]|nr:PQQ-binding-like beta-propeller repeat protein [Paracoccaceae bacterium]
MKRALKISGAVLAAVVVVGFVVFHFYQDAAIKYGSMAVNYVRYMSAPKGTLTTEMSPDYAAPEAATPGAQPAAPGQVASSDHADAARADTGTEWASYNRTLTSNRFSPLDQITGRNADGLKVLCTYDTGEITGFNSGILEVDGALLFATEFNLYSIDPDTCKLNWRAHEEYTPATPQGVNRGPAYMDGKVFRGTQDGRVIAYDFKTGKALWQTRIADPKKGESVPAAPIAWNGMVFAGNAGGDIKGVKGRMYGLDAQTGTVKWEFYLVPKSPDDPSYGPDVASPLTGESWGVPDGSPITGGATWTSYTIDPETGLLYVPGGNPAPDFAASLRTGENLYSGSVVVLDARTGEFRRNYKIVPKDWHDWDVSGAPAIITTAAGRKVMTLAPKDGHLYGYDLSTQEQMYRLPVTKMQNTDEGFEAGKSVHFCPGSTGGAEWNGPAYDAANNLIIVGEVEWCTTVTRKTDKELLARKDGQTWGGEDSINPFNTWGKPDPTFDWAGWVYAVNADTGDWKWRVKSNYPVQSGVTPTAGGVVFFGDMGGNFYALNADTGEKLWGQKIGGAVGGGVITYDAGHGQRVAAATGLTEVLWPTEITTAKVSILGLASEPTSASASGTGS